MYARMDSFDEYSMVLLGVNSLFDDINSQLVDFI
jgi:hypothetical protein